MKSFAMQNAQRATRNSHHMAAEARGGKGLEKREPSGNTLWTVRKHLPDGSQAPCGRPTSHSAHCGPSGLSALLPTMDCGL